ncbi:MAG TPA: DUF3237 domain-containing protein [Ktedonobacterales bacterium]|nr:DUF3237 domain-containing protein [Ktedonobacterales bacterium]
MPTELRLEFLCEVSLETVPPQAVGSTPQGKRQIVPITGGTFAGPHLSGKVLTGGDWLLERSDGVRQLDARVTWQTDDGALLYVTYQGYRVKRQEALPPWLAGERVSPETYYHMFTVRFETRAEQ